MSTHTILVLILLARIACYVGGTYLCLSILYRAWSRRKHVPIHWTLPSLFESARTIGTESTKRPGCMVPCRPHAAIDSFGYRLKCAWWAFSGKCDLVRWPEGQ